MEWKIWFIFQNLSRVAFADALFPCLEDGLASVSVLEASGPRFGHSFCLYLLVTIDFNCVHENRARNRAQMHDFLFKHAEAPKGSREA